MGLGTGLTIATTGLRATQAWADAISRNIANASTPGYTRKDTVLSTLSGGVTVSAYTRSVSASLDQLTRTANSKIATQDTLSSVLSGYTSLLGQPEDETSPVTYLSAFRTSLETLATDPSSTVAQRTALTSAKTLATSLNEASTALSTAKADTESAITTQVSSMNELLTNIGKLNDQLTHTQPGSLDNGDLQDQMGNLLDELSGYANFTVSQTTDGQTTVYAPNGMTLVDSQTTLELKYDGTKLTANGIDLTPASSSARGFTEGSIAGLFQLKNTTLPTFGAQLDAMAATLITSFSAADASLATGQAGLFTDAGAAWDGTSIEGLAARLSINADADPDQGGDVSLIRDGFGATTEGAASDGTQINAFLAVFDATQSFDASAGLGSNMKLSDYVSQLVATQQSTRADAESRSATLSVSAETLSASRENMRGVNTDDEMAKLLAVQQNYAANSKVLTTLVDMLDTLLEAT